MGGEDFFLIVVYLIYDDQIVMYEFLGEGICFYVVEYLKSFCL